MGKGDKKTKKGKRTIGSAGVSRPSKRKKRAAAAKKTTAEKAAPKKVAKKAAPKKVVAKKVATKTAAPKKAAAKTCLLYTSDAADERSSVDLGGRRIIKKKKIKKETVRNYNKNKEK